MYLIKYAKKNSNQPIQMLKIRISDNVCVEDAVQAFIDLNEYSILSTIEI